MVVLKINHLHDNNVTIICQLYIIAQCHFNYQSVKLFITCTHTTIYYQSLYILSVSLLSWSGTLFDNNIVSHPTNSIIPWEFHLRLLSSCRCLIFRDKYHFWVGWQRSTSHAMRFINTLSSRTHFWLKRKKEGIPHNYCASPVCKLIISLHDRKKLNSL